MEDDMTDSEQGQEQEQEQDWNTRVIDEFRANQGRVGGYFEGTPLLLLHHTGAKSGTARVTPLVYLTVGESYAVFASNAGKDDHPAWYHNLIAHPHTRIEVGGATVDVSARVAGQEERTPVWTRQKQQMPGFAEYEAGTSRQIPVVLLEPTAPAGVS
jgi:deazaflavin-dependent oxidoreductase (nitroreductase family)